jgi:hypothetical protein
MQTLQGAMSTQPIDQVIQLFRLLIGQDMVTRAIVQSSHLHIDQAMAIQVTIQITVTVMDITATVIVTHSLLDLGTLMLLLAITNPANRYIASLHTKLHPLTREHPNPKLQT